jgi:hypothetical protein
MNLWEGEWARDHMAWYIYVCPTESAECSYRLSSFSLRTSSSIVMSQQYDSRQPAMDWIVSLCLINSMLDVWWSLWPDTPCWGVIIHQPIEIYTGTGSDFLPNIGAVIFYCYMAVVTHVHYMVNKHALIQLTRPEENPARTTCVNAYDTRKATTVQWIYGYDIP